MIWFLCYVLLTWVLLLVHCIKEFNQLSLADLIWGLFTAWAITPFYLIKRAVEILSCLEDIVIWRSKD